MKDYCCRLLIGNRGQQKSIVKGLAHSPETSLEIQKSQERNQSWRNPPRMSPRLSPNKTRKSLGIHGEDSLSHRAKLGCLCESM